MTFYASVKLKNSVLGRYINCVEVKLENCSFSQISVSTLRLSQRRFDFSDLLYFGQHSKTLRRRNHDIIHALKNDLGRFLTLGNPITPLAPKNQTYLSGFIDDSKNINEATESH